MPVITYHSVCTRKALLARDVYELRMTKPAGFSFKPGQFILFSVPLVENPADIQTRAFSIASSPGESDLLFVAKLIAGGRASRWIDEVVTEGMEISFTGPFGNFLLDTTMEKEYLFIATSTGVAPFRSMMADALSRGDARPMDLLFGVKSEEDLFWYDELRTMAREHPTVSLHVALSDPSPAWTGHRGWVQAVAPGIAKNDFTTKSLYVCGNPAMTKDVKSLALGEWGMGKNDVHVEGYI